MLDLNYNWMRVNATLTCQVEGNAALKSLPPASYQALPALPSPAGYILVIRDIDSDGYRIDATEHPQALP